MYYLGAWLGEWRFGMKIRMGDFHSSCLVRESLPILIPGWNRNDLIYLKLNPYSPLWIQIFIPIPIPVTNQMLRRIWPFRFRFRFHAIPISIPISIPIFIPISVSNQTPPEIRVLEVSKNRAF